MALIHDLGSFRRKKLTIEKEINRLMHADYVIASNDAMKTWLKEHGYQHPLGALQLFDYRSTSQSRGQQPSEHLRLVYAGALAMRKNSFLLKLAEQELPFELHIYGNRNGLPNMNDNPRILFHPFTPADTFIQEVEGDFGFVWDGDSLDSCTGNFGEYLRWNSPHKVSFYLRAGLPIIIWKEAAVAPIVEKEGIGITIENIQELGSTLGRITPEQLAEMRKNVLRISERLREGEYLQDAISQALQQIG